MPKLIISLGILVTSLLFIPFNVYADTINLSASPDTITLGGTTQLTAGGCTSGFKKVNFSYTVSPNPISRDIKSGVDVDANNNAVITFKPSDSGTYTITAQCNLGTDKATTTLIVNDVPGGAGTCRFVGFGANYQTINNCAARFSPTLSNLGTTGTCVCKPDETSILQAPSPIVTPSQFCKPGDPNCTSAAGTTCNPSNGQTDAGSPVPEHHGVATAIGCIPTEPQALVQSLLKVILAASGGIALLMMAFGAIGMITSGGNAESLKNAQGRFTSAIIGLLFIIFAVFLLKVIGVDILAIPGFHQWDI